MTEYTFWIICSFNRWSHCWVCSCDFHQAFNWNPEDSAVLIRAGEQPEGSTRSWGSSTGSRSKWENASNCVWGQMRNPLFVNSAHTFTLKWHHVYVFFISRWCQKSSIQRRWGRKTKMERVYQVFILKTLMTDGGTNCTRNCRRRQQPHPCTQYWWTDE